MRNRYYNKRIEVIKKNIVDKEKTIRYYKNQVEGINDLLVNKIPIEALKALFERKSNILVYIKDLEVRKIEAIKEIQELKEKQ